MKILVTGGCGFLGSHICEYFVKKGWEAIAYDNLTKFEYSRVPYFNVNRIRNYNLKFLKELGVTVIIGDIRNQGTLVEVANGCDYIAHTAAQPAMTISMESPEFDFGVNAQGTLNVLNCARGYNIPVVNCSTIHIYGNGINSYLEEGENGFTYHPPGISEQHPILLGNLTPLHASKRTAEIYVQTYIDTYKLKAANFRLTGMYGCRQFGGEDHGWVANFAIRTILGLPIKIFGTDKQVRDILYIKDAAEAFWKWYENGCPSGTYNIGGGKDRIISLRRCLEILKALVGKQQDINILPPRQGDLYYFCCNTTKAENNFNWLPTIIPSEGIYSLVQWIKENKELFKI